MDKNTSLLVNNDENTSLLVNNDENTSLLGNNDENTSLFDIPKIKKINNNMIQCSIDEIYLSHSKKNDLSDSNNLYKYIIKRIIFMLGYIFLISGICCYTFNNLQNNNNIIYGNLGYYIFMIYYLLQIIYYFLFIFIILCTFFSPINNRATANKNIFINCINFYINLFLTNIITKIYIAIFLIVIPFIDNNSYTITNIYNLLFIENIAYCIVIYDIYDIKLYIFKYNLI